MTSTVAGNTRFAANQLATAGDVTDTVVTVNTSFGPKHAVVQINDTSDDAVAAAVARSEALAKLAPDDPDAMPPARPAAIPDSLTPTSRRRPQSHPSSARVPRCTALQPARASSGADASVAAGVHHRR